METFGEAHRRNSGDRFDSIVRPTGRSQPSARELARDVSVYLTYEKKKMKEKSARGRVNG